MKLAYHGVVDADAVRGCRFLKKITWFYCCFFLRSFFPANFWIVYLYFMQVFGWFTHEDTSILRLSSGADKNPNGVSVDGNTVSTLHFARRYGRRFLIIIAQIWASLVQLLNNFVWLWITDEGLVPEMRMWYLLLIKSDLKWCKHLSRSLSLYW